MKGEDLKEYLKVWSLFLDHPTENLKNLLLKVFLGGLPAS